MNGDIHLPPDWKHIPGLSLVIMPDGTPLEVEITEDVDCEVLSSEVHKPPKKEKKK